MRTNRRIWYLRSMLSASVMVLQRFSSASKRCGSSFRNFTASTSTLSTTRILLCKLGNWSGWEGESDMSAGCTEIQDIWRIHWRSTVKTVCAHLWVLWTIHCLLEMSAATWQSDTGSNKHSQSRRANQQFTQYYNEAAHTTSGLLH